jgi:beta-xylosidase
MVLISKKCLFLHQQLILKQIDMRRIILLGLLLSVMAVCAHAQNKSWTADNGNGTFTNPLFYDEFSDPDILRVGDDYYLAGTTMHAVPGLVILHSKDLVNWENIAYCFDRFDFTDDRFSLKNHQEIYGQGIWAPCIRYANGQFYVYSNVNGKGLQCYTAKDIRGPWEHHNMKGNIYDLGVLFDDDGKVYAIHGYGTVKCTELYPDMSGPKEGTERVIIPEGNGVGEGHHIYKIDGMYYLISTDYSPNGRTLCSRSKSIWGPYETRVITADETYGYHAASLTQVPQGVKYRIGEDGTKFGLGPLDKDATACTNAHQGGIVQATDGSWWALFMQDFHSIGRTVCLMPMTWQDGWPMVGLKGNLGRAPRTWFIPGTNGENGKENAHVSRAPYERSENFDGKQLGRVWQWNHNPEDKMWKLKGGKLRLNAMPAEQLMWARNTLTQRVIGPSSIATVEMNVKGMKDGDVAGLGNINVPCSWIGIVKQGKTVTLRCFEQLTNDTVDMAVTLPKSKIWLRCMGDYDNDQAQYAYSTDGEHFQTLGRMMPLSYQLISFQGSRHALFAFNIKGKNGGYVEFDNFTVEEPQADRSQNIPYGKTFRIINKATGRPAICLTHGLLYDTGTRDKGPQTQFRIVDHGNGKVALQCVDGRYVKVYGEGLPGDVRFTTDPNEAEIFLWQDYLGQDFMLFSLRNHRYIGKSPTTGSPYSMDFSGPDPARRNGSVLHWEEVGN